MIQTACKIEVMGEARKDTLTQLHDFIHSLNLEGECAQTPDGVVLVVRGQEGAVRQCINFCKQGGSFLRVHDVIVTNLNS
ncbi:acylphosphatase [Candidatus Falkowbacteria bacterium]|nr:acylphosphatase [Candidatus Falkowbacteria bacterium]